MAGIDNNNNITEAAAVQGAFWTETMSVTVYFYQYSLVEKKSLKIQKVWRAPDSEPRDIGSVNVFESFCQCDNGLN